MKRDGDIPKTKLSKQTSDKDILEKTAKVAAKVSRMKSYSTGSRRPRRMKKALSLESVVPEVQGFQTKFRFCFYEPKFHEKKQMLEILGLNFQNIMRKKVLCNFN